MPKRPSIFIVDDQRDVLESIRLLLKGDGYLIETFQRPDALLAALQVRRPDAVLMDLNYTRDTTSGNEGLELIAKIRAIDAHTPLVVMTAWGSIELAVEAIRRGAQDFVEKPWNNERLRMIVRTQVALDHAVQRMRALEGENRRLTAARTQLLTGSARMREVIATIDRVAPSDAAVLLTGESGTGKGLVARMLHERSMRREQSLVIVNVGSLPETVFESELFGHVKGAFTDAKTDRIGRFELADNGTVFLDEITNINIAQQARLLRVLEEGRFERLGSSRTQHVNVRVIAATNADLDREVEQGRFRRDLLYRLNTVSIHLPPLRERDEDVILIARYYLAEHAKRYRRDIHDLSESSIAALLRHPWPGNVRELNHVIERAVLLAQGSHITPADLALGPPRGSRPSSQTTTRLEEIEQHAIRSALDRNEGDVAAAADELGVSRSSLYRRIEKFGL